MVKVGCWPHLHPPVHPQQEVCRLQDPLILPVLTPHQRIKRRICLDWVGCACVWRRDLVWSVKILHYCWSCWGGAQFVSDWMFQSIILFILMIDFLHKLTDCWMFDENSENCGDNESVPKVTRSQCLFSPNINCIIFNSIIFNSIIFSITLNCIKLKRIIFNSITLNW